MKGGGFMGTEVNAQSWFLALLKSLHVFMIRSFKALYSHHFDVPPWYVAPSSESVPWWWVISSVTYVEFIWLAVLSEVSMLCSFFCKWVVVRWEWFKSYLWGFFLSTFGGCSVHRKLRKYGVGCNMAWMRSMVCENFCIAETLARAVILFAVCAHLSSKKARVR